METSLSSIFNFVKPKLNFSHPNICINCREILLGCFWLVYLQVNSIIFLWSQSSQKVDMTCTLVFSWWSGFLFFVQNFGVTSLKSSGIVSICCNLNGDIEATGCVVNWIRLKQFIKNHSVKILLDALSANSEYKNMVSLGRERFLQLLNLQHFNNSHPMMLYTAKELLLWL